MKSGRKKQFKHVMVQTKVDPATAERLDRLVKIGGYKSKYELVQYLVSVFLRVADAEHEPEGDAAEHQEWAEMLQDWNNKTARIITSKPVKNNALKMVSSINIFTEVGKRGHVSRMIKFHGSEGDTTATSSIDKAVNEVLIKLWPQIHEQLQEIARACGSRSDIDAIKALLETSTLPRIKADEPAEEEQGPAMNEYGNVPVRHNNKQMNE